MPKAVLHIAALTCLVVVTLLLPPGLRADGMYRPAPGWTLLASVGARILRDANGVPHIFADDNYALFYAYGYAVAQDRLWQLDLFRRTARGTLSEVLGPSALASDRLERIHGYTEEEYLQLYEALSGEAQEILSAYRDGINAYLQLVRADPEHLLPWEFHQLDYRPSDWQVTDSLAISRFMIRRWGESGGQELSNQALLQSLIREHGQAAGTAMYSDLRWRNDPDAPTSVPHEGAAQPAHIDRREQVSLASVLLPNVEDIAQEVRRAQEAALAVWETYGIPTTLGSFAFAVSPARSANGHAMLYGGPQMGWETPDIVHQVQLTGGNGFNVIGIAFAGIPLVSIGYNERIAWTVTSGMGDNVDLYIETLNPADPEQYWFDGSWQEMITRTESFSVAGRTEPVQEIVRRTIHGPVIALDEENNLAYSLKRAHWLREPEMFAAMLDMLRARTLAEFERGVGEFVVSNHLLYADREGNIAYWQAGAIPIRPDGAHVGTLPWKGDGSEEWQDRWRALPHVVNPPQGYLANWNNKPSPDFDNGDAERFGKQHRVRDIGDLLAADESITWDEMAAIPLQIAALLPTGNETRYLRSCLLRAIGRLAPEDARLLQVAARLAAWDGRLVADAVADTLVLPQEQIWSTWLSQLLLNTFGDELGTWWTEADINVLLHALDGAASGVPPSRDYFDDVTTPQVETRDEILVRSLREALDLLESQYGSDTIDSWTTPRPMIPFDHPLDLHLGEIPASNRATYGQLIELSDPSVAANTVPLGQSGFVDPQGDPDPHLGDRLEGYRRFEHQPMRLIIPTRVLLPFLAVDWSEVSS